jgi:hypothetical protein
MKNHYFFKSLLTLALVLTMSINAIGQIRIVEVNPATETVKIHNYGTTTVDISSYRFCSLIVYRTLNTQTTVQSGSLNLAPNADVVVTVNDAYLNDTAADLGLYLPTGSFASAAVMVDFTQWGSGGNGRESVAVTKGIWTAGTFINVPPPYEYTGNGGQNGFQFWGTLLSVDDFETGSNFKIFPNPSDALLNIELKNNNSNGSVEIYDMLGKKVISQLITNEYIALNVSQLNTGLYLIKIITDNGIESKRFVKN